MSGRRHRHFLRKSTHTGPLLAIDRATRLWLTPKPRRASPPLLRTLGLWAPREEKSCLHLIHLSSASGRWNWPGRARGRSPWLPKTSGSRSRVLVSGLSTPMSTRGSGGSVDPGAEKLARLRKENPVPKMERDLLSRAATFLASENALPK